MKTKIIKAVSVVAAMACLLCFPVKASATAQQGTNGTELEVVQAAETVPLQARKGQETDRTDVSYTLLRKVPSEETDRYCLSWWYRTCR